MKCGVLVFPASNGDMDMHYALKDIMNFEVSFLWHKDRLPADIDMVVLPGGSSYGNYLRPGAIARYSPIIEDIISFADNGGLVLGVSNGFQILTETKLLPGAFIINKDLKFICNDTLLKVENTQTPFTSYYKENQIIKLPIAHKEGNYYLDPDTIQELEENKQIVLRYCDKEGEISTSLNPNGSLNNIAAICSKKGNVLGMMPHPERCVEGILGSTDGIGFFKSLLENFRGRVS